MPVLPAFDTLHWETGSVWGALAHLGLRAPHTRDFCSEAMLFGLSRGIGAMYVTFAHAGYEPFFFFSARQMRPRTDWLADLGRRLGFQVQGDQVSEVDQALAAGGPVIAWADRAKLPWSWAPTSAGPWVAPILVLGLENGVAQVADRARVPLTCPAAELAGALGPAPRLATLHLRDARPDLPLAVAEALAGCAEGLAGGPTPDFGLPALLRWADLLTDPHDPRGWPALFPTDRLLFDNLVRTFLYIELEGTGGGTARPLYAAFLEEAAELLDRPALRRTASLYRECGGLWTRLAQACLPYDLRHTRDLLLQREARFRAGGLPCIEEGHRLAETAAQVRIDGRESILREMQHLLREVHAAEVGALQSLLAAGNGQDRSAGTT